MRTVIERFSGPGRTFLVDNNGLIDISHESLIRFWTQLGQWVEREKVSAEIYGRLTDASRRRFHPLGLYGGAELTEALAWQQRETLDEAWADRYDGRFHEAMSFLKWSRVRRNASRAVLALVVTGVPAALWWQEGEERRAVSADIREVSDRVFADRSPDAHLREALRTTVRAYGIWDRLSETDPNPRRIAVGGQHERSQQWFARERGAATPPSVRSRVRARRRVLRRCGIPLDRRVTLYRAAPVSSRDAPLTRDGSPAVDTLETLAIFSGPAASLVFGPGGLGAIYPPDNVRLLSTGGCAEPAKGSNFRQTVLIDSSAPPAPGLVSVAISAEGLAATTACGTEA